MVCVYTHGLCVHGVCMYMVCVRTWFVCVCVCVHGLCVCVCAHRCMDLLSHKEYSSLCLHSPTSQTLRGLKLRSVGGCGFWPQACVCMCVCVCVEGCCAQVLGESIAVDAARPQTASNAPVSWAPSHLKMAIPAHYRGFHNPPLPFWRPAAACLGVRPTPSASRSVMVRSVAATRRAPWAPVPSGWILRPVSYQGILFFIWKGGLKSFMGLFYLAFFNMYLFKIFIWKESILEVSEK